MVLITTQARTNRSKVIPPGVPYSVGGTAEKSWYQTFEESHAEDGKGKGKATWEESGLPYLSTTSLRRAGDKL